MLGACFSALFWVFLVLGMPVFPTPVPPELPGGYDPGCVDKLKNCPDFGKGACAATYKDWARANCEAYCGFCRAKPTTPPACEDAIDNCESYGAGICTDKLYTGWVDKNCRFFCRYHVCTPQQIKLEESLTTTIAPENCVDKLDCRPYGNNSCTGDFKAWAKENCMNYCGFCNGTPTNPPPCVDKIPNCSSYEKSTCTDQKYAFWAEENCRKFCGFCSSGVPTPVPAVVAPNNGIPTMLPGVIYITPSIKRKNV